MKQYDVVVIGGGHAGTEAAAAAARMGVQTALVTMRRDNMGTMSCNPAIGGLGKGHLVREIDALDGIMGQAADRGGIQFRLLNQRKGPAVQGPRTQADRKLYRQAVQSLLAEIEMLDIIEAEVAGLRMDGMRVCGVTLADGSEITAKTVILTAGTFLNGVIHVGSDRSSGGRVGDKASLRLAEQLASLDLQRGRLKTGTPARLDGRTINWDILERQEGDAEPSMFSFLNKSPFVQQIACGITHTNERTHEIVRDNLQLSAMYGGHIEGVGPRYCPSIEDKIVRFADKSSHQVFLEPEGLDDHTVYPNGISTSLPAQVQDAYIRSIVGLENVTIIQPGYAIEYDYFDPRGLTSSLEVKGMDGLFFAGQINGTTGYEEAGAQGLVAGLNAAAKSRGDERIEFSRTNSYIGVMIDDLTSRGVSEPYRMFTSRAEYRLTIRADNADQRLTPKGLEIGCVGEKRAIVFNKKMETLTHGRAILDAVSVTPNALAAEGVHVRHDGSRRSGSDLLAIADIDEQVIAALVPDFAALEADIRTQLRNDAIYARYQDRQDQDAERLRKQEEQKIPTDFDYDVLSGLSTELKLKLKRLRPESIAQAGKIEGMTPAALLLILARLRRGERQKTA